MSEIKDLKAKIKIEETVIKGAKENIRVWEEKIKELENTDILSGKIENIVIDEDGNIKSENRIQLGGFGDYKGIWWSNNGFEGIIGSKFKEEDIGEAFKFAQQIVGKIRLFVDGRMEIVREEI